MATDAALVGGGVSAGAIGPMEHHMVVGTPAGGRTSARAEPLLLDTAVMSFVV